MARLALKSKPLWSVSVVTTPEAEDAVAEMLGSLLNRPASSYFHLESGTSTVTVYCEARPAGGLRKTIADGLRQIDACGLEIGSRRTTIAKIRREDWAESWKRHFKPIEIRLRRDELHKSPFSICSGTRITRPSEKSLLIKPSWSKRKPRKNQAVVVLDPGLSFGTGQHPTTAFCLREIVAAAPRRQFRDEGIAPTKSLLDIGTGSGILAIAAAKLGYQPVHAFDFDANAVEIARVNAWRNGVSEQVRLWRGNAAKLPMHPPRKYDLICANLISDLLVAERRRIAAQLNAGGTLVLAGILKSEFGKVRAAFESLHLELTAGRTEKEWRSGSFRRT